MVEDDAGGVIRTCNRCRHCRPPRSIQLFAAEELQSAGALAAQAKWDEQRRQRATEEMQRAEAGLPFDYPPHHFAWCAHYTSIDLVTRAQSGDQAALNQAMATDAVTMNPVTGEISALYELCQWRNPEGNCEQFTPVC